MSTTSQHRISVRQVARAFALLPLILPFLGQSYAFGQAEYSLIRIDSGTVSADGYVSAYANDDSVPPDWTTVKGDGDEVTDQISANVATGIIASQGGSDANVSVVSSAFVNAGWNDLVAGPNSTVGIGGNMGVFIEPIHNQRDYQSAFTEFLSEANAGGAFELQPMAPPDPDARPVLYGALHVIIIPPHEPFHYYGLPPHYDVSAGSSWLHGEWDYNGWKVSGELQSLDNGVIEINNVLWPPNVNIVAMVAEEVTVGDVYSVGTHLVIPRVEGHVSESAYPDGDPTMGANDIPIASLAAWFAVRAEDDSPSDFVAHYVYDIEDEDREWRIDVPDPQPAE